VNVGVGVDVGVGVNVGVGVKVGVDVDVGVCVGVEVGVGVSLGRISLPGVDVGTPFVIVTSVGTGVGLLPSNGFEIRQTANAAITANKRNKRGIGTRTGLSASVGVMNVGSSDVSGALPACTALRKSVNSSLAV